MDLHGSMRKCIYILGRRRRDLPLLLHLTLFLIPYKSLKDWVNLTMAIICVTCAALASGLTIGLLVSNRMHRQALIAC